MLGAIMDFMWSSTKDDDLEDERVDMCLAFNDNQVFLKLLASLDDGFANDSIHKSWVVSERRDNWHGKKIARKWPYG